MKPFSLLLGGTVATWPGLYIFDAYTDAFIWILISLTCGTLFHKAKSPIFCEPYFLGGSNVFLQSFAATCPLLPQVSLLRDWSLLLLLLSPGHFLMCLLLASKFDTLLGASTCVTTYAIYCVPMSASLADRLRHPKCRYLANRHCFLT